MDDEKTVDFKVENGELICGNEKYIQFIIRNFQLEATEFSVIRRYYNSLKYQDSELRFGRSDPKKAQVDLTQAHVGTALFGKARIDRDSLSVIGAPELITNEVSLEISKIKEEDDEFEKFAWRSHIFLSPFDWEIGNDDSWCVSITLPRKTFDELGAVIENKNIGTLSMSLETDLWAHSHDAHAVPAQSVKWFLTPDDKGRVERAQSAHGIVTNLSWTNKATKLEATAKEKMSVSDSLPGLTSQRTNEFPFFTRLGKILGWLGNVVAILALILAIYFQWNRTISVPFPYIPYAFVSPQLNETLPEIIFALVALMAFIIGRALRYLFAGSRV